MRKRKAERFPNHLRRGRGSEKLASAARRCTCAAEILLRIFERDLFLREARAHGLHASGIFPFFRQ